MSILKMLRERTEPLNVAELARLLAVTAATVQRWVRNRQMPFIRIGDVLRFDGGMLADWIEMEGSCNQRPRAPGNLDDYQMRWTDLGELAPEEIRGSTVQGKSGKKETK
jgi:excisionase family DNA binding protein